MDDMPNRKSGARGIRFPSNNTIEFNFPFKVDEGVRNYIRAALGLVTEWYNDEQARKAPGMAKMEIVSAVEMDNYGWIKQTLERVGPERSMQFTVPHKGTEGWGDLWATGGSGCTADKDQSDL